MIHGEILGYVFTCVNVMIMCAVFYVVRYK